MSLGSIVHSKSASSISRAERTNLPYIATATRDLAEVARHIGLDTLSYLLEMAAVEAEQIKDRNNNGTRGAESNMAKKLLSKSAMVIFNATEFAQQHLQYTAEIAEGTVVKRRVSLRKITATERVITRRQAENRRLLKQLIKKAS